METTVERSGSFLRDKGIKASFQRVSIFDYLQRTTQHPSVAQIFADLHSSIPSLSRATVYNTINLFVKKKIAIPVQLDGAEARYDLADPQHAHFHCVSCQKIYDIPVAGVELPVDLKEFEVQDVQLHFSGRCPSCR